MTDKELIQNLKQLKNNETAGAPSGDFISKNREIMLMQIKNSSAPAERPFSAVYFWRLIESVVPENVFRFVIRPAVLSLLAFGVAFGSWAATVSASYDSLPGDKLYSLKRMAEEAQLSLTSKDERPSLQIEMASRRLDEVAKIAEKPSILNKEERTKQAVKNFTEQIQSVKIALENLSQENKSDDKAMEVAQMVDRKTTEYATVLKKTGDNADAPEVKKEVEAATSAVSDAGIKAIEVIVKKSEQGMAEINKEDVVTKVEEKIKIIEQSASQITTSTISGEIKEGVKEAIIDAKAALNNDNLGVVVDKLVEAKNLVNTVFGENAATSSPSSSTSTNK